MLSLGIDIGATKAHGVVVDDEYAVVAEDATSTQTGEAGVTSVLLTIAQNLAEKLEIGLKDFSSVGIGIPGVVNRGAGEVTSAVNLHLGHMLLADTVSPHFAVPIRIDNDVKATVAGAAGILGCDCLTYLNVGTGLACATVERDVIRGSDNAAGEIGHFSIDPEGDLCRCGQHGCLETIIGGNYLAPRMERLGLDWTTLDQDSRPEARAALHQALEALARTVTLLVLAYDSRKVVLGGGVVRAAPWLNDALKTFFSGMAETVTFPDFRDIASRVMVMDDDYRIAAVGAALMGRHD